VLDTESSGGQRVMSGCLHLGSNIKAVKELCLPPSNMKVIFLVRDVADMLWAAYNYWCNVATDGPSCFPGKSVICMLNCTICKALTADVDVA
jgi:hypothetical protein